MDLIDKQITIDVLGKEGLITAMVIVDRLPSVDAVEVVRCKDCKHRGFDNRFGFMCNLDTGDPYETGRDAHNENWYCADGEQKDG